MYSVRKALITNKTSTNKLHSQEIYFFHIKKKTTKYTNYNYKIKKQAAVFYHLIYSGYFLTDSGLRNCFVKRKNCLVYDEHNGQNINYKLHFHLKKNMFIGR